MPDKFIIRLTIDRLQSLVENKPNHCDFEYFKALIIKLEKLLEPTCGTCEEHCGNDWCVTKGDKDE